MPIPISERSIANWNYRPSFFKVGMGSREHSALTARRPPAVAVQFVIGLSLFVAGEEFSGTKFRSALLSPTCAGGTFRSQNRRHGDHEVSVHPIGLVVRGGAVPRLECPLCCKLRYGGRGITSSHCRSYDLIPVEIASTRASTSTCAPQQRCPPTAQRARAGVFKIDGPTSAPFACCSRSAFAKQR